MRLQLALVILCWALISQTFAFSVDSVRVDSVWNNDSSWVDLNGQTQWVFSRDCRLSLVPQGKGFASDFVLWISLDSGKTWDNSQNAVKVVANNFGTSLLCGQKGIVVARIFGKEKPSVTLKMDAQICTYGLPSAVDSIINEAQIDNFIKRGMTINFGSTPPDIQGNYVCDSLVLTGSNVAGDFTDGQLDFHRYMNYSYKFYNQTPNGRIQISRTQAGGTSSGLGSSAVIIGNGNDFSIFVRIIDSLVSSNDGHSIIFESARILSGTISTEGIVGFKYAFICTNKLNDTYNEQIEIGEWRVIAESDNLASRVTAYPFAKRIASRSNLQQNDSHK